MREINYRFKFLSFIGILCVICGHIGSSLLAPDRLFIYDSFHVPLFFFISGYFFNRSISGRSVGNYLLKKAKKILIPLWGWTFVYLLFCFLMRKQNIIPFNRGVAEFGVYDVIVGPFTWIAHSRMNIAAWFVGTLFIVECLHVFIWVLTPNRIKDSFAFILFFIIIGCLGIWIGKNGLFTLDKKTYGPFARVLYCWLWYAIGMYYKSHLEELEQRIPDNKMFLFVIACEIILSLLHTNTGITSGVYNCKFPLSYIETILIAGIAILFWLRVSKIWGEQFIRQSKTALLIANHTFDIMMHHGFAVWVISATLYVFNTYLNLFNGFDITGFAGSDWYVFIPSGGATIRYIYLIACILIPLLVSKVLNQTYRLLEKVRNSKWRKT